MHREWARMDPVLGYASKCLSSQLRILGLSYAGSEAKETKPEPQFEAQEANTFYVIPHPKLQNSNPQKPVCTPKP